MGTHRDVEVLVDEIIERVGTDIRLAVPAALGKPNALVNALVQRALDNELTSLTIMTALSLAKPAAGGDLLNRLMGPIAERCFGDYPDPTYVALRAKNQLPDHIRIHEFYYPPGLLLGNAVAQQDYVSVNFTHVSQFIWQQEFNVLAQLVAPCPDGQSRYNLSCNPDLSLNVLQQIARLRQTEGTKAPLFVGQVNQRLPVMDGAFVASEVFDAVLEAPEYEHELFGRPTLPPNDAEYFIGIQAAALIADGGTLQIGIGNIGDAIAWAALLRHTQPDVFARIVERGSLTGDLSRLVERWGGTTPFERGLYASTEMLVEGLVRLYEGDVLKRQVFEHEVIQRWVNARGSEVITIELIDALVDAESIREVIRPKDHALLQHFGIIKPNVVLRDGHWVDGPRRVVADVTDEDARAFLAEHALGDVLKQGAVAHGAFFLGSQGFYDALRALPHDADHHRVCMAPVEFTNKLYGQESLKRAQRLKARFVNECMKVTLTGSVVSDGLDSGRVVSGVGGQYEFVSIAHELEEARSILVLLSTRTSNGETTSNIVPSYGHMTIPRYLRDIIITEYGVADLRGKADAQIAQALIEVADSRFQPQLIEQGKAAGKLPESYTLPEHAQNNTPERVESLIQQYRQQGIIPRVPFGTELTDLELDLVEALGYLGDSIKMLSKGRLPELDLEDAMAAIKTSTDADAHLERMGLAEPEDMKSIAMQRLLLVALAAVDAI